VIVCYVAGSLVHLRNTDLVLGVHLSTVRGGGIAVDIRRAMHDAQSPHDVIVVQGESPDDTVVLSCDGTLRDGAPRTYFHDDRGP
jgi:hypothetical protein